MTLDPRDPKKQTNVRDLLRTGHSFAISTQVCQELFVTAVAKCAVPALTVKEILRSLSWAELVTITAAHIEQAIDLHVLNQISFWDSLILSAAQSAKCSVLWTEDLNQGQTVGGVKIVNPFVG
jgi:predicted nucleic acid-binding protein